MKEIEFNLLDEPWIRVRDDSCQVHEVSLTDALLHAHQYTSLSGELPTQDIVILRLMLAVLHTVFSRVDADGNAAELEDEEEAVERWTDLWELGQLPEEPIREYLEKWHERFWLFHPERPFGQVAGLAYGTQYGASKLNGEISESGNKVRLFSSYLMLLLVNRIVSKRISSPILKLDASVRAYEAGEKPDIYIGGSYEIRHLGKSVQHSYEEIERLMKEIVKQQNERRKSELAALQSQINPHFLYNTLESITWMVEANKNQDAVFMISELAKLFRISLSRGKTIISIEDELKHCKNYMNIQKYRYKERFVTEYDVSEEIYPFCTVKLILQPILENAIYYGVGNMDEDDQPKIIVKGWKDDAEIYISVADNGMGMRREDVENILKNNQKGPKHGSGVGLINVHTRIQLMFGSKYGLIVESEPDEGTTVTIHLPAVPYTKENCEALETPGKPTRNEGES